jgi:flagellar assembly protein FliH
MSTLLKASLAEARTDIRALAAPSGTPIIEVDPRLRAMEQEIERLASALDAKDAEHVRELEAARESGRAAAADAFSRDEEAALEALKHAIAQACETWTRELEDMERLAATLAEIALERVFGDAADQAATVERAIAHQIAALRADTMTSIMVSEKDFSSEADLAALAAGIGRPQLVVRASAALKRGECRIALRLGELDISVSEYWSALRRMLRTLGAESRP